MSKDTLKMTYHPAKKEVLFERFDSAGGKITIRKDSRLYKYMNQKGNFVLQDRGDDFFEDIAKAFDGETAIDMNVVTTVTDVTKYYESTYWTSDGMPKFWATRPVRTTKPKSSTKKEDPYNVNDYYDPEDFYDDNYDDFWDYEDAEDYYNEYHD